MHKVFLFCSGFGQVDAFLIQGYLRETYLSICGPKFFKLNAQFVSEIYHQMIVVLEFDFDPNQILFIHTRYSGLENDLS